jgi:hypothetical protein
LPRGIAQHLLDPDLRRYAELAIGMEGRHQSTRDFGRLLSNIAPDYEKPKSPNIVEARRQYFDISVRYPIFRLLMQRSHTATPGFGNSHLADILNACYIVREQLHLLPIS